MQPPDAARATAPGALLLGRYQVSRELARGGFGAVLLARDTQSGQDVAIKYLLTNDPRQLGRFDREMKLTSKLTNPHTVRLLDYGEHQGAPVMVMEFVQGQTLMQRLAAGALPPALARQVITQTLSSLTEAHSHGIVHRDLKPANIMLTGPADAPHVKVLDFGAAGVVEGFQDAQHQQITAYGELQGTPAYMAPEQVINFSDACTQSDLYAMGLILFECVTGRVAVTGPNSLEVCRIQVQEPLKLDPATRDGHFGPVIERATAKATAARYQTAEAMRADLDAINLNAPPPARPKATQSAQPRATTQAAQAQKSDRTQRAVLIAAGVLALVAAALTLSLL